MSGPVLSSVSRLSEANWYRLIGQRLSTVYQNSGAKSVGGSDDVKAGDKIVERTGMPSFIGQGNSSSYDSKTSSPLATPAAANWSKLVSEQRLLRHSSLGTRPGLLARPPMPLGLTPLPSRGLLGASVEQQAGASPNSLSTVRNSQTVAYLAMCYSIFLIASLGALLTRRHLIMMMLLVEVMLLSCTLGWLFTGAYLCDVQGQLMATSIMIVAAAETAIGLAMLIIYFRLRS